MEKILELLKNVISSKSDIISCYEIGGVYYVAIKGFGTGDLGRFYMVDVNLKKPAPIPPAIFATMADGARKVF